MSNNSTLFFISENTSVIPSYDELNIIEETKSSDGFIKTLKFKPLLQDSKVNGNKRLYTSEVLNEIVSQLSEKIKKRNGVFMEIDHPMSANFPNKKDFMARAVHVSTHNSAALIKSLELTPSGEIYGIIETLAGFKGPDFTNVISVNKVDLGFSLRMLGGIKPHPTMEGVNIPSKPLQAVTYDIVQEPSHNASSTINFLTENTHKYLGAIDMIEQTLLTESTRQENILKDTIQLEDDGKNTIKEYLKKLINDKYYQCEGNLKFNI